MTIIVLTGPSGVGKTDTGWAIVEASRSMVFLDCDGFAFRRPFSWDDEADVEAVYESMSLVIGFHRARAAQRFVLTLTLEMADRFGRLQRHLDRHGLPLRLFRLRGDDAVLIARIAQRDRIDSQKQAEQAEQAGAAHAEARSDRLPKRFMRIDTTALESAAVPERILAMSAA